MGLIETFYNKLHPAAPADVDPVLALDELEESIFPHEGAIDFSGAPGEIGQPGSPVHAPTIDRPLSAPQVGGRTQYLRCSVAQSFTALVPNTKQLVMQLTGQGRKADNTKYLLGQGGNGWTFANKRPDRLLVVSDLFPVGDPSGGGGDLVSCRLNTVGTNDTLAIGMCYGMIERVFVLDDGITVIPVEVLARGYFTQWQPLTWPNGGYFLSSLDGPGVNILAQFANQFAGALQVTVPLAATWRLKSVAGLLSTDPTAGNRFPFIRFNSAPFMLSPNASSGLLPSQASGFSFFPGANPTVLQAAFCTTPIPEDVRIGPLGLIQIDALNIAGGDEWEQVFYQYEEWLNFTG